MKQLTQFEFINLEKTFKIIVSFLGILIAKSFFMKRRAYSNSGFSLVEVLIVIGMIIIIAAIAMPSLQGYVINRGLRSAAREFVSDINEFKERAIAENREYRITLTPGTPNYTVLQCAVTGSSCPNFPNLPPKSLAVFESSIIINNAGTTVTQYDFQTRGTVTNGTIILINQRGSTADIRTNITGRASVQFTMQ